MFDDLQEQSTVDEIDLPDDEQEEEEVHDHLADMVLDKFRQAKAYRSSLEVQGKTIDDWLLRLYRAYNKIHEQDELEECINMKSYFGLVQIKSNIVSAYIRSKYISSDNPPFSIQPTPIVDLPKDKDEEAFDQVQAKLAAVVLGEEIPFEALLENGLLRPEVARFIEEQSREAKETFREEQNKLAGIATAKMSKLIKDQLIESNFTKMLTEALLDIALYPAMIVGYDNEVVTDKVWKGNKFVEVSEVKPMFRRIEPLNAYFAPNATNAQDGDFFIEVLKRSKAQLSGFLDSDEYGYFKEEIEDIIENGDGDWLSEDVNVVSFGDYDDEDCVVLRCQTLVLGKDLIEYGITSIKEADQFKYFNADIEVCNNRVIRCSLVPHPKGHRTYFSASYKRVAGEPYGISVGMMIYDRQMAINRTQYAMLLNSRYSAGPMLEVNAGAFDNPSEVTMQPFTRVYSNPTYEGNQGIRQHQIQPTFAALFVQMTNEIRLADDECGLPSFLNGNAGLQGAGQTLGGLAMMTDNAVLGLKDCALNIDEYLIKPAITLLYARNLLMSKDKSIKADAKVIATGLMGLEAELNKSKELAGLMPQAGQLAQQGTIPQDMYQDMVRDYLQTKGIDTDRYMMSEGVQGDVNSAKMQSPTAQLDGRSLKQM